MKKAITICALGVAAMLAATPVMAAGKFRVKVAQALSGDWEQSFDTAGWTASSDYVPLALSVTYIAESGFFIDLTRSSSEESGGFDDGYDAAINNLERVDTAVTLGMAVKNVSVFGGYRTGETTQTTAGGFVDIVEQNGIFFGLTPSTVIRDKHVLSGTVAMAFTSGSLDNNNTSVLPPHSEADFAVGFGFGAGYGYRINDHLTLGADYKFNVYALDFTTDFGDTITEEFSSLSAYAAYTF